MSGLTALAAASLPQLVTFTLVLARVCGLFVLAPLFGARIAPVRARAGLAFFLAVAMLPLSPPDAGAAAAAGGGLAFAAAAALETGIGTAIGLVAQLVFGAIQLAGQLIGIQIGIGLANLIDPQTQEHITSLAQWQNLLALMIFLAIDGHHVLVRAVADSVGVLPVGGGFPAAAGFGVLTALSAELFVLALKIAAPVLVTQLLTNAAMGVLAKVIPQLNVFVVGFPLNVAVGFFVLAAAQPFTVRLLLGSFADLEPALAGLVRALG
jgi:flagellar biosynthetic protein FliR